jgi:hypothetical protein
MQRTSSACARSGNGGDPSTGRHAAPFKTLLNQHRGVSNAVIFAHVFAGLAIRRCSRLTANLNFEASRHNAPAWWL